MADILVVAGQLNAEVTRLNNERSKLEGMLESSKISYEKAVKAYEEKYGVKLTEKNLQQEYNEVFARTKGNILDVQEKIESIKRGDYKKEDVGTSYDLEPDVEPIRAEVEPEKKKRGRKPKAAVVPEVVAEPEEVKVEAKKDEVEIPNGPLDLNLDFSTMEPETVVASPVEEVKSVAEDVKPVVEDIKPVAEDVKPIAEDVKPIKEEKPKASKKGAITPDELDAILEASETVVQHPETANMGIETDDDDDEVSLDGIDLNIPFGANPVPNAEPKKEESVGFGGFGDFGGFNFGGTEDVKPAEEVKKTEVKPVEEKQDLGFGDFSGFNFGGFDTPEPKVEPKKEEANTDETITPDGWGSSGGFGDFGGFGDLLNSSDIKFGE